MKVVARAKRNGRRGKARGLGGKKLLFGGGKRRPKILLRSQATVVYNLQKLPRKSGWEVDGTRLSGSFHWKISGLLFLY